MHKYLSLSRVLLKNTAGMISDGKTKKTRVYALYILLALCFLPTLFLMYSMFKSSIDSMQLLQQEGAVLAVGFHMSNFVTFFFSIFLIPGVFYFSKDCETLLGYPLKPQTILGAKFIVCLFYEYVFVLFVTIPLFFAYIQIIGVSLWFYPMAFIILLTLPLYPLVLASILTMLVMRFMPFFKNRDRFNMIAGIISVVLAMSLSFTLNNAAMNENAANLITMLMSGENSLIGLFAYVFPSIPFAADALINGDFLAILVYLGINVIAIALFVFIGNKVYFKGAIGLNETGSNRKSLSTKDFDKALHRKSISHSFMQKEMRLILRTPIYFLNCIATNFILPIIMAITILMENDVTNLDALKTMDLSGILPYAIYAGLILGMFISNMNLISSTAISREGSNMEFMKYIPISLGKQIRAKINCGIFVATIASLVMIIVAALIVPVIPILNYVVAFLASLLTIVLGNYLGILIDLFHPKLVWEQEAAAVKQNLSSMVALFGGMILSILIGISIFFLPFPSMEISIAFVTGIILILCVILYVAMPRIATTLIRRL